MLAENLQTWAQKERQEGYEEGYQEGYQEGFEEGLRLAAVQKLLQLKFGELPDWANQQIEQADSDQVDQWMSKILEEETLEALFHKR